MIKLNILYYVDIDKQNKLLNHVAKTASEYLEIDEKLVLNVVLSDNDFIKEYNEKYRNIPSETDVLSFPSDEDGELGDIIISIDRVKSQSIEYNHSFERELSFLLIHGILHCLGYDHQTKDEEEVMFALQNEILNKAGITRNDW